MYFEINKSSPIFVYSPMRVYLSPESPRSTGLCAPFHTLRPIPHPVYSLIPSEASETHYLLLLAIML